MADRYALKYVRDQRFTFGTGKLGDLAGFTSAVVLAMIALLIGYEAISHLFAPVPIRFGEAIPIAELGLAVDAAGVWVLSGGGHHVYGHHHDLVEASSDHRDGHEVMTSCGILTLSMSYSRRAARVTAARAARRHDPRPVTVEKMRPTARARSSQRATAGAGWRVAMSFPSRTHSRPT